MSLTTIPIQKETREKLKQFASKSDTWDEVIKKLLENAIASQNASVFFSKDSLTGDELLEEIENW